ncbi:MAG: hypothetical protein ACLQBD_17760 [Syntrophobacteraceae bacterium]
MAEYDLTLQFYGGLGLDSLTIKTKSADVDEEDVKDILNSFVENPDVQPLLGNGFSFVVAKVNKVSS